MQPRTLVYVSSCNRVAGISTWAKAATATRVLVERILRYPQVRAAEANSYETTRDGPGTRAAGQGS